MMISRRSLCASMAVLPLVGCTTDKNIYEPKSLDNNIYEPKAVITDENYLKVMGANPKASIIAQGFQWCEGPVWDIKRDCLYFTDVPQNKAFRWDKTSDAETFLYPSGAEGVEGFREPGANGLFYDKSAKILLCNHGRRAVERLDPDTGTRELLIGAYKGKKFNSPNDIVISKTGHIFFTDPPYGLEGLDQSPLKELEFNGVYHLTPEGDVRLIDTSLSFPNGIALSPDETSLYVNQSDPNLPIMKRYKFGDNFKVTHEDVIYNFSSHMGDNMHGLPDGMAVDLLGNIFATGPGGIYILSSEGHLLGQILLDRASSNCAFGEDGQTLFITNQDRVLRMRTQTYGVLWG